MKNKLCLETFIKRSIVAVQCVSGIDNFIVSVGNLLLGVDNFKVGVGNFTKDALSAFSVTMVSLNK